MLDTISAPDKLLVTGTASHRGRFIAVSPKNNPVNHVSYGRIRLDSALASAAFHTDNRETALMCMKGACRVTADGKPVELDTFDAVYVPRGSAVEVSTTTEVDLVECSADVEGTYPLQVIRYAEVSENPTLKFTTGGPATTRDLNIIIGKNVQAGRLLAGFTRSHPGHWTSWPPHEHSKMLEEVYVFFDMPAPAFAIQLVYTQPDKPEFVRLVHDGDAVLIPEGYHPTVAAPGCINNFIWIMAAHREVEDRQFGVVNVQPEFAQGGSGLEASRK